MTNATIPSGLIISYVMIVVIGLGVGIGVADLLSLVLSGWVWLLGVTASSIFVLRGIALLCEAVSDKKGER